MMDSEGPYMSVQQKCYRMPASQESWHASPVPVVWSYECSKGVLPAVSKVVMPACTKGLKSSIAAFPLVLSESRSPLQEQKCVNKLLDVCSLTRQDFLSEN